MSRPHSREGLAKDCTSRWGSSSIPLQRVWVQEGAEKWDISARHPTEGTKRGPPLSPCLFLCRIIEANTRGPMSQLRIKDEHPFWEEVTGAFTGGQETAWLLPLNRKPLTALSHRTRWVLQ